MGLKKMNEVVFSTRYMMMLLFVYSVVASSYIVIVGVHVLGYLSWMTLLSFSLIYIVFGVISHVLIFNHIRGGV